MTKTQAIFRAVGLATGPLTRKQLKQVDRAVRGNERFLRSRFSPKYAKKVSASHPWHKAEKDLK